MRRNTQRLYESIMKVVDRSVRKALNENDDYYISGSRTPEEKQKEIEASHKKQDRILNFKPNERPQYRSTSYIEELRAKFSAGGKGITKKDI